MMCNRYITDNIIYCVFSAHFTTTRYQKIFPHLIIEFQYIGWLLNWGNHFGRQYTGEKRLLLGYSVSLFCTQDTPKVQEYAQIL